MQRRILALAPVLALLPGAALAQADNGGWPDHGPHMMGWGGWFMGPLGFLVLLALAVAVVVIVVRTLGGGSAPRRGTGEVDRSLDILRERYARGEIDAEEFEERKRTLDR